jgi:biotin transporter BioY
MDMSAYMGNVVGKYWGSNVGKCWYMEHIGCIWMYHLGFIWLYDFWFPPIKRVKKVQINLAILSVKWLGGKSPSWGFSGSC